MGILNHSLGTKEFVLFSPEQWTLDSNFFLTILHNSIVNSLKTYSVEKPRILYIQTDNCSAESKNQYLLAYLALLVENKIFDEIYFHTLIPGHTHEDIDQLFSVLHQKLETANIETIPQLMNFIEHNVFNKSPIVSWLSSIYDWKTWMSGFCNKISGHKSPHAFLIKKGTDGKVHLYYKKYSQDMDWLGNNDQNVLFNTVPTDWPTLITQNPFDEEAVKKMVDQCRPHLSEEVNTLL